MGTIFASYPGIGDIPSDEGLPYYARIVEISSELLVPDNWFNVSLQFPNKYYKAAQITLLFEDKVIYHKYLNFEKESHGIYALNSDVIMPLFIYPLEGEPGAGSSGGDKTTDDRIRYQISGNPELHKSVIKAKPYLLGWMKCVDRIIIEPFAEGVTAGAITTVIR